MGLKDEGRGRVDNRRDGAGHRATARLLTLLDLLLAGLLALLRLLDLLARLAPNGFATDCRVGPEGGNSDRDDQFPLHGTKLAPAPLNGK